MIECVRSVLGTNIISIGLRIVPQNNNSEKLGMSFLEYLDGEINA